MRTGLIIEAGHTERNYRRDLCRYRELFYCLGWRDFRYVVSFIVQFGLYISPVGFSSSIVPERLRNLVFA
jgi:ABC-type polysaccharide/polyol phosphate export permease